MKLPIAGLTRGSAARWAAGVALILSSCGEELPEISLQLSKNCNEVRIDPMIPSIGSGHEILDIAADSALSNTAWVLLRRPRGDGNDELVVQQWEQQGPVFEQVLVNSSNAPISATIAPALSLEPAPESGEVWVVREEPGVFELWKIDPDNPGRSIQGSENLADFPSDGPLCDPCNNADWPRDLLFMDGLPALASLPPFSVDAGLVVWVGLLDTDNAEIRMTNEHRLNFEPPCEDDSPEGEAFCEDQRENLRYPEVTVLGKQEDPRLPQTVFFGHRTRAQTFGGSEFPIESADVFMVSVFIDGDGIPAGILRSYSGFYSPDDGPLDASAPPLPSATPPFGVAVDRFAAYGLFSNGGVLPRMIQLPDIDPDFVELTGRLSLEQDIQLLQLDRDLALGRLLGGQWEVTKIFPDRPEQSQMIRYAAETPIQRVVSGGVGTFMLRKDGAPPEVVRVRCAVPEDDAPADAEP